MLMYNLIEYNDNYSKTYGNLCQYYKDLSGEVDKAAIADSESVRSKV